MEGAWVPEWPQKWSPFAYLMACISLSDKQERSFHFVKHQDSKDHYRCWCLLQHFGWAIWTNISGYSTKNYLSSSAYHIVKLTPNPFKGLSHPGNGAEPFELGKGGEYGVDEDVGTLAAPIESVCKGGGIGTEEVEQWEQVEEKAGYLP